MKKYSLASFLSSVLFLVGLASPLAAFAIYDPTYLRPIQTAQMEVVESSGSLYDFTAVKVFLAKNDGAIQPTALILDNLLGEETLASIDEVTFGYCGDLTYLASFETETSKFQVTLADQRNSKCKNGPQEWVLSIEEVDSEGANLGLVVLDGKPQVVYSILTSKSAL